MPDNDINNTTDDNNEGETPVEQNENENESNSVTIDWSSIDPEQIPFDVLKKTSAYREQRQEAIENRLKAKEVIQNIDQKQEQESTDSTDPLMKELNELRQMVQNITQQTEQQKRESLARRVLKENSLPDNDDLITLVTAGDVDEDVMVERVKALQGLRGKPVPPNKTSAGGQEATDALDGIRKRIKDRLSGNYSESPFDALTHKRQGGGY